MSPEFMYAKGRIIETIQFISKEIREFENEYEKISWQEYGQNSKIQKLIERTVENILTAFIELAGTYLAQMKISGENYSDILRKFSQNLACTEDDVEKIASLASQRNRLAHRYLDYKWQAIKLFKENKPLLKSILTIVLEKEEARIKK
jgi:uncharacterized protein YutE (UPF0331/DUF86 family)